MSKKNAVVVMPVSGDNIDSSIDMKLTKQDLIDMVIEETRDALENSVADARDAYEEEKRAVETAHKTLKKLFCDAIEAKFVKEFKLLKAHGGISKNPTIQDSNASWNRGLIATEHGVLEASTLKQDNVRTKRGHYSNKLITEAGKIVSVKFELPEMYEARNQVKDEDDEDDGKRALCILQISLQLRLPKADSLKLFAPFGKLVSHLGETHAALEVLEDQHKNVDKMGKKAKTQLVKRMLESSGNGQAILSNMGAIKSSVGQLLLDSAKKA